MKVENRVFFRDETEAKQQRYRPCAVCLPKQYRAWKGAYAT
jgi:methylphosphotriester-DNA--protein-cysteine methyltransferase